MCAAVCCVKLLCAEIQFFVLKLFSTGLFVYKHFSSVCSEIFYWKLFSKLLLDHVHFYTTAPPQTISGGWDGFVVEFKKGSRPAQPTREGEKISNSTNKDTSCLCHWAFFFAYAWNAMLCFPNKWNERKILEWIYPHFVTITQAVKKESDFINIRAAVFVF